MWDRRERRECKGTPGAGRGGRLWAPGNPFYLLSFVTYSHVTDLNLILFLKIISNYRGVARKGQRTL